MKDAGEQVDRQQSLEVSPPTAESSVLVKCPGDQIRSQWHRSAPNAASTSEAVNLGQLRWGKAGNNVRAVRNV